MITKLNYYLKSMIPTFIPGDLLTVVPYAEKTIRAGDVIVFTPPGDVGYSTHRIIKVSGDGVITRGDNIRNHIDPWILNPKDILGFVAYTERNGRKRRVFGGRMGLLHHRLYRALARFFRLIRSKFFILAQALHFRTILRRLYLGFLLPSRYRPRILNLKRMPDNIYLLLMGNRIIGWRLSTEDRWDIRIPYRLFVRETLLLDAFSEEKPSCAG